MLSIIHDNTEHLWRQLILKNTESRKPLTTKLLPFQPPASNNAATEFYQAISRRFGLRTFQNYQRLPKNIDWNGLQRFPFTVLEIQINILKNIYQLTKKIIYALPYILIIIIKNFQKRQKQVRMVALFHSFVILLHNWLPIHLGWNVYESCLVQVHRWKLVENLSSILG